VKATKIPGELSGHLYAKNRNSPKSGSSLVGKASWYSKRDHTDPFTHKKNADGTRFNENAFTCAMRSRDFGKAYRVTNLSNGKSIIVIHRDFGPAEEYKGHKLNRIADLSKAAFARIANLDQGEIDVKIEQVSS
ncbi:MAG: septal ring lytic transglycosylase RlpA family protein, partial [Candidatus Omnitrophica bacterium]|nr:septal ring lytic transglycosylase RlpA family protein [Candidatus Omnitrophota bacterium]